MANRKKKFQLKKLYFLSGPLSLVAYVLLDVLGGLNFPGYNWVKDPVKMILAGDSNSLIIGLVFLIIYTILAVWCGFCVYYFYKQRKSNKLLRVGLLFFMTAIIVGTLSMAVFNTQKADTQKKAIEYAQTVMKTEKVEATDDTPEQTNVVVDEEATQKNHEKFAELCAEPDVLANAITSSLAMLFCLAAYILIFVGGFKKKGQLFIGCAALISLVFLLYGSIGSAILGPDMLGINQRFSVYCDPLFITLAGGFLLVTHKGK